VAELVDALVSGTSGESRGGSSPLLGTIIARTYTLELLARFQQVGRASVAAQRLIALAPGAKSRPGGSENFVRRINAQAA
jgi:hypothetical protein